MKFSWTIFAVVLAVNSLCMGLIYVTQTCGNLPPRGSIIPGTAQKFLYAQDFWVMTLGDLVGLMLIFNVFAHLVAKDSNNLWWAIGFGLVVGLLFFFQWMGGNHKPDYAFPAIGKISLSGALHQIYFGIGAGAAIVCVWNLFSGEVRGPVMWAGLTGGAFYVICSATDHVLGNFEPFKKIVQ